MSEQEKEVQEAIPMVEPKKEEKEEIGFNKERLEEEKAKNEKAREEIASYLEEEHGITKQNLDDWKSKYKKIYVLFFDDEPVIVRGISRQEWRLINSKPVTSRNEELNVEDQIAKQTILFPQNALDPMDPSSAGLASTVFKTVLQLSKFEPDLPPIRL